MAIYDPPDGSTDPRPRCTGDCCRGFAIEKPYAEVLEEARRCAEDPTYRSEIADVRIIADMLVSLGKIRGKELFTCRHLTPRGDCGVYETRPRMCRDFPGAEPCPYRNCASHGPQPFWKRAWNWLCT